MKTIKQNPYENLSISNIDFGVPKLLTVRQLKKLKALDEQRDLNRAKMLTKIRDEGFNAKLVRPILISDIGGQDQLGDYKITDGQHTLDLIVHTMTDDTKIPVVVYKHNRIEAAKSFASWNKEGVQLLSGEQVFPAQVAYGDPNASRTLNVLTKTGRKFEGIKSTHNYGVGSLNSNKRIVRRGKLEEAIRLNREACELALDTQAEIWPTNGIVIDSVLLTLGWTYLFNYCPELCVNELDEVTNTNEPFDLFKKWIATHPSRKTQEDWIYSGRRAAQREKQSIAKLTLTDFLMEAQLDPANTLKPWFKDLSIKLLSMD